MRLRRLLRCLAIHAGRLIGPLTHYDASAVCAVGVPTETLALAFRANERLLAALFSPRASRFVVIDLFSASPHLEEADLARIVSRVFEAGDVASGEGDEGAASYS